MVFITLLHQTWQPSDIVLLSYLVTTFINNLASHRQESTKVHIGIVGYKVSKISCPYVKCGTIHIECVGSLPWALTMYYNIMKVALIFVNQVFASVNIMCNETMDDLDDLYASVFIRLYWTAGAIIICERDKKHPKIYIVRKLVYINRCLAYQNGLIQSAR